MRVQNPIPASQQKGKSSTDTNRTQPTHTHTHTPVDVGVVDACGELDLGGLEGVVCGEVDGEEEDAALVGRVGGPHDSRLPVEEVVAYGAGAAEKGEERGKGERDIESVQGRWGCAEWGKSYTNPKVSGGRAQIQK